MDWKTIAALALGILVGWYAYRLRDRQRQKMRARPPTFAIRTVPPEALDPMFAASDLGPTPASEAVFLSRGSFRVPGGTTDAEAWILAALAKRAKSMFEFGTCTGKTTYLWGRNSAPDARVVTLTLAPNQANDYRATDDDNQGAVQAALKESRFTNFLYSGTAVEQKITQLFGDSKAFDETPYVGKCDLVFVDGSHAYSYVVSDSEKALRMVMPGGLILWHDYSGAEKTDGVTKALEELSAKIPLVHVEGTTFVAHRAASA